MAGMAVLASDLPVYHRACDGGAGVLAGATEAWSDALEQMIYRPDLRSAIIERAQAKLGQRYTHECLRAQVMAVFDRALEIAAV